jgi:multicomponent Na+:H+ antiporter subunit D
MIDLSALTPLVVAGPLAVGAAMLAVAHFLPPRVSDAVSLLTALAVFALCAALAVLTHRHGPFTYWFGGWTPRPGVTLGVGFEIDPGSAAVAAFIALIFAMCFLFAWGYFDDVKAHFHVLMLLFLAAMIGFVLTRDIFNLFVWFEVMSVAAFALTAYQLETPSLVGALDFTVVNSLASFMMLGGVGLLYARAGALDFDAIGATVARAGPDPVIAGGFCLLAAALMTKGAIVPFHFWLSDAHAVAPSPVSVIFSGAMVAAALFALAKLSLRVFAPSADAHALMSGLFTVLGCATAVLGGVMAWLQRHLKRMLAFSTIAHLGIMLCGLATLSSVGVAGLLVYMVGHGLVKGALFMLAGILLATRAGIDELNLKGLGRGLWPAGVAMGLGALLLGGAPWGVLHAGSDLVASANLAGGRTWVVAAVVFGGFMTGGAVLRATGRIFLDLGPDPGEEANAPSQAEQEKADRPLWLMMIPVTILLLLAVLPAHLARPLLAPIAHAFASPQSAPAAVRQSLPRAPDWIAWLSTGATVLIAASALFRRRLPGLLVKTTGAVLGVVVRPLRIVHSGIVSDYVTWMAVGVALFAAALAIR